ncbi:MAG: PAS domain S-box [Methanobacterium sp. Maddingley MBC34]|nr:MAG: PAS domain S-box [Methanobacterium sp. Maddingley MBC34]
MEGSEFGKKFEDLREKAEEVLKDKKEHGKKLGLEIGELIHELEVHQIELEMQNENLIKTQIQLEDSRRDYIELYDFAPVVYFTFDEKGIIKRANLKAFELLGVTRKYLINTAFIRYIAPHSRKVFQEHLRKVKESQLKEQCELELLSKEKNPLFVSLNSIIILDKEGKFKEFRSVIIDITEGKVAEKEIEKSLAEKEILLKEIHHRVKNNLQVISSLLNLQSEYIKDKTDQELFRESQTRARSMALIHERLYQSTDLRSIDFGEYIKTLTFNLYNTYGCKPDDIQLNLDLEPIPIDINTAIPCGLVINELLSNAMKHAFPGDRKGEINIKFHQKDHELILSVQDNGIGLPPDMEFENISSLGLKLVNTLVSQIDGEIEINSDSGTNVTIKFPEVTFDK